MREYKALARQIGFDEIQAGDRLRVRYTVGGREATADLGIPSKSVSVTRTLVSEVCVRPLDSVWLSEDGHTVVHRKWDDLSIVRLSGPEVVVEDRTGLPWTAEEEAALRVWDKPDASVAAQIGRTRAAVMQRRGVLKRKMAGVQN